MQILSQEMIDRENMFGLIDETVIVKILETCADYINFEIKINTFNKLNLLWAHPTLTIY